MDLYFKPVTSENREQVEALKTAPGQEGFIESVSECMKENLSECIPFQQTGNPLVSAIRVSV